MFCYRMEETVRAMLVYKSRTEQLKQEKQALAVAYEVRNIYCLSMFILTKNKSLKTRFYNVYNNLFRNKDQMLNYPERLLIQWVNQDFVVNKKGLSIQPSVRFHPKKTMF